MTIPETSRTNGEKKVPKSRRSVQRGAEQSAQMTAASQNARSLGSKSSAFPGELVAYRRMKSVVGTLFTTLVTRTSARTGSAGAGSRIVFGSLGAFQHPTDTE